MQEQGHHLERREDPDRAVLHPVEVCECCGRDLSGEPIVESLSRQVFDLPEIPRLDCVEHWIQKRRCGCGHLTGSSFPAGVSAPACYGPRIRALGIDLVCYQHLPVARAAAILSDWVRAPISVATLQAFVTQGADGLEGFLEEIRGQLQGRRDPRAPRSHARSGVWGVETGFVTALVRQRQRAAVPPTSKS